MMNDKKAGEAAQRHRDMCDRLDAALAQLVKHGLGHGRELSKEELGIYLAGCEIGGVLLFQTLMAKIATVETPEAGFDVFRTTLQEFTESLITYTLEKLSG